VIVDTILLDKVINDWETRVLDKVDQDDASIVEMVEDRATYLHKAIRDLVSFSVHDLTEEELRRITK